MGLTDQSQRLESKNALGGGKEGLTNYCLYINDQMLRLLQKVGPNIIVTISKVGVLKTTLTVFH